MHSYYLCDDLCYCDLGLLPLCDEDEWVVKFRTKEAFAERQKAIWESKVGIVA